VDAARERYRLTERTACRIVGQPRGTQRYVPTCKPDEDALTRNIVYLASTYGRYGYRRVTAIVVIEKWRVHYNTRRPHSALGYRPPAPLALAAYPAHLDRPSKMQ